MNSRIICKQPTKESLEGFWDPTFMKYDKVLKIDYLFQNRLHSVTVDDDEDLVIPQPSHAVSDAELEEIRNQRVLECTLLTKKKTVRKIVLVAGLVFVGGLVWWLGDFWPFSSKSSNQNSAKVKSNKGYAYLQSRARPLPVFNL